MSGFFATISANASATMLPHLLVSKYSEACHALFEEISEAELRHHFKIIWADHPDARAELELSRITTVPCIVVAERDSHHRVIYQGDQFKMYWKSFVHSNNITRQNRTIRMTALASGEKDDTDTTDTHVPNRLNHLHSHAMIHVAKIRDSIEGLTQSLKQREHEPILSDENQTRGIQTKLEHLMKTVRQDRQAAVPTVHQPNIRSTNLLPVQRAAVTAHNEERHSTLMTFVNAQKEHFANTFNAMRNNSDSTMARLKKMAEEKGITVPVPPPTTPLF